MKKHFFSLVTKILIVIVLAGNLTGVDVFAYEKEQGNVNAERTRTQTSTDDSEVVFNKIDTLPNEIKSIYTEVAGLEKIRQVGEIKKDYVEGEVLVKYKNDKINLNTFSGRASALNFINSMSLEKKEDLKKINISVLKIKDAKTVEQKVAELKNDPNVEYAEPNYRRYLSDINADDTNRGLLWGLDNTGQTVGGVSGTNDADIDAPEAWAISEGSGDVIVAVIDSGVAYNHPDLVANMWDGASCKDENGATIVGGCNHGFDYEDSDNIPLPTNESHGTHIAGTIAAVKDNGRGIIGVAPQAKIMAIKFNLTVSDEIKAIDFAIQNGAKVINASFGATTFSQSEYDAIDRFKTAGGIFVAAAGNGDEFGDPDVGDVHGQDIDFYPCDFDLANIICVAATDQNDALATFSDYGATSVDVGAPGVNILSTIADTEDFSEDFEGDTYNVTTGGVTTSNWIVDNDGSSAVAYSDKTVPYEASADTWLISDSLDLSNSNIKGATLSFTIWCDTPSAPINWQDYIQTTYYNGVWNNGQRYDEDKILLDGGSVWIDSGQVGYYKNYTEDISTYLSNDFKFSFDWHTDSLVDNNLGCTVDNIKITTFSDGSDERYEYYPGTSMATPHVAGLAALIFGYNPELNYTEVKNTILATGDDLVSLAGKTATGKRINAYNALNSLSETEVSGNITEDTTWTSANSPYHITETVSVYPGVALIIEPGVIVKADAEKYLQIAGTIIARGNENNLVTFTSYETGGSWGGIKFIDSAEDAQIDENYSYISGSIIEYADVNSGLSWDCIRIEGASPFISHSDIHNCANGIFIYNFPSADSSDAIIHSNTIRNIPIGYGIQQTNKVSDIGLVKIINNEITNTGTGIVSRNGQGPQIRDNIITNNKRGISLESSDDFLVENNIIDIPSTSQETSIGMNITSNSFGTVQHNNLSNDANVQPSNSALNIHNSNITVQFNTITASSTSTIRVNCLGVVNCSAIDSNNIYNTADDGYAIWNWGNVDINALNNYWGTTNSSEIDSKIFDFYDDPSLGKVIYNPFVFAVIDPFDVTSPILFEVTSVTTPTNDDTPDYTFSSNEVGTITYGGSCSSLTTMAIADDNTITFNGLADNLYSDCTITVTDAMGNESLPLSVSAFTIDTTSSVITISGTVKYYDGVKTVSNATVILEDADGVQLATTTTDENGTYEFTDVENGGDYVVRVEKSDNVATNGVDVLDLTKIRRNITEIEIFDQIFKKIATDVNNDLSIDVLDLVKIRRYITEIDILPSEGWKFYSSDAVLDTANYLTNGLNRAYTNLIADMTIQDFVGIKMGDVNNSWVNN